MSDVSVAMHNQYLSFTLGKEKYGINIINTREVLEAAQLTRVPRMPEFMCGVINLRGSVVPILDLKVKFNMDDKGETIRNNIIVTEVDDLDGGDVKQTIGIYTDSVQKVLTIEPEQIESVPRIGIPINTEFMEGMGKVNDDFIILLNINKILNAKDLNILKNQSVELEEE